MSNSKTVLVIAPHQDDETIGCGGTICKLINRGYEVNVVHVFLGTSGVPGCSPRASNKARHQEAQAAAKRGGYKILDNLGFVDRDRSKDNLLQTCLIKLMRSIKPSIVFAPHAQESDYEHRLVSIATREAVWLAATEIFIELGAHLETAPRALYYEVWKSIEQPMIISDVTDYQDIKRLMLEDFLSQMMQTSWVDGSLGRDQYRGATTVGRGSVEVFETTGIPIEEIV